MILDATTPVAYPNREAWGKYYAKFQLPLVNSLSSRYSYADREDAVEEAFHKLMHKKDPEAYGEKMPRTESDWYWNLHWQARSFLSRIKERAERHAKYVERAAEEVFGLIAAVQGAGLDDGTRHHVLVRALEMFRDEQDISRRNLDIYTSIELRGESVKSVCARHRVTENNAYQIKFRVKSLLRKHGPGSYRRALRAEVCGYLSAA